ncbi:hypothetical protein EJB05_45863, partial [Eragrostis curvula]
MPARLVRLVVKMPPRRSPRLVTPDTGSQLVAESSLARSTSPRRGRKPKKELCFDDDEANLIKHRFSTKRVINFVDSLGQPQKDIIKKYGFEFVFELTKFCVPVSFLEWLMVHTSGVTNEFIYRDKVIRFGKDMVKKVFKFPTGKDKVETYSHDFEVDLEVDELKSQYRDGRLFPISRCMSLMKDELDEHKFMRSFMLFLISTILIPGKNNDVQVEYLYSLRDMSKIAKYDWADKILDVVMCEVHRFHSLRNSYGRMAPKKQFYFDGCLPLLAIVYSDFLDLPQGSAHVHSLDYRLPRITHFTQADINYVMQIDKSSRSSHFGVRPFRDISLTPYCPFE